MWSIDQKIHEIEQNPQTTASEKRQLIEEAARDLGVGTIGYNQLQTQDVKDAFRTPYTIARD